MCLILLKVVMTLPIHEFSFISRHNIIAYLCIEFLTDAIDDLPTTYILMNLRTCLNTVHVVICLSISTKVTPLTLSTGASLLHMLIRYTSCLSCGEEEVMLLTGAPIL